MIKFEMVKLDDVCVDKIHTLSSKDDFDIEYVDISSIDNQEKIITSYQTINSKEAPSRAKQILKENDVLVSTVRPNLNAVAINRIKSTNVVVGSTGICVLRCNKDIDVNYLFNFCKSKSFVSSLAKIAKGASYPAVGNSDVRNSVIPLPPLETQHKIAAVLDEAQALIDKRKEQITALDEFVKSVFLDMFGDPVTNPKGWQTTSLASLGVWASGGTPNRAEKEHFRGDVDWFSAGELNSRYLKESKEKITSDALKSSTAKLFMRQSLLVGMYDTAAFKLGILTRNSSCNQACANINPNLRVCNIEWLYSCFELMRPHYLSQRRGIRQKNLNLGMIKGFTIILPSLPLQNQFATIVEETERQKELMQASLNEMELLFNSLMQKAFRGELFA